jgi:nicotinamidase-related amidase
MTTIPAEPYGFPFAAERCTLLIIDMERDFLEPGGFGTVLGNDVSSLRPAEPSVGRTLEGL